MEKPSDTPPKDLQREIFTRRKYFSFSLILFTASRSPLRGRDLFAFRCSIFAYLFV